MFSTNKRSEGDPFTSGEHPSGATVIAHGVKVEGDFSSQGDVFIEGDVYGSVSVAGMLHIGSQARLGADLAAEQAVIAGIVEGNVTISAHLELKATAQITGDVSCETIAVESGAALYGKISAGPKPSSVRASSKQEEARAANATYAKQAKASA